MIFHCCMMKNHLGEDSQGKRNDIDVHATIFNLLRTIVQGLYI